MKKTMRAMVIKAPMDYSIEDVPVPEVPAKGLLLKVEACGLCGSDLRTLRSGHRNITFPWTIGHEVCGTVCAVGGEYDGKWQVGERLAIGPNVYCGECDYCRSGEYELCEKPRELAQHWQGGLAEYMAIPYESLQRGNIEPVSEGVDPVLASVAEPISSCINAQQRAGVTLGNTVVIIGSGPIGCIHIALARLRGASKIFIVDINDSRLAFAEDFGADALINAEREDPIARVLELTGGKGADVVIAATPAPVAPRQGLDMAKKGGKVIQFGGLPKDNSIVDMDMNKVHYKGLYIIGTTTFSPMHFKASLNLITTGQFPAEKLVSHRYSLEDFAEGSRLALEGKVLKGVFQP